jgi:hypothetical protein
MNPLSIPGLATQAGEVARTLSKQGYCVASAAGLQNLTGVAPGELDAWLPCWNDLPPDRYLKDGGHYRYRRHGSFTLDAAVVGPAVLQAVPHRAHYQPTTYNALHGGMLRWFDPLAPAMAGSPAWARLVGGIGRLLFAVRPQPRWFIEAHAFRIDTADGVGRPTPEGAHRDGVDFVAVIMVGRHDIRGGETRVFEADGPNGVRFTLREPWSVLLLDDHRVIHESTPIQPDGAAPHRDTLVLTFRGGGFLEP